MRIRLLVVAAFAGMLISCGSEPKSSASPLVRKAEAPRPPDETRRLPKTDLVDSTVVNEHLMGKTFMPGGTLGKYQKGKKGYEIFVAKTASPTGAALLLPDWQKALANAKLVPAYGGYFGDDGGRPVFVFSKGAWIAGIAGLSEKEADAPARILANNLN